MTFGHLLGHAWQMDLRSNDKQILQEFVPRKRNLIYATNNRSMSERSLNKTLKGKFTIKKQL